MEEIKHYINGEFCTSSGSEVLVTEPATGVTYAHFHSATEKTVARAYEAAENAFKSWSTTSAWDRYKILIRIASLIEKRQEELVEVESRDTGKPLTVASKVDIPRAAKNFEFFASAALHFQSESVSDSDSLHYTIRKPLGVVACISPWNLPLYLFSWKVAPALACGNTVIGKPSEITPGTAAILGEICTDAGLPDGVLNILQGTGPETGSALVNQPGIKAISFTGGTNTGKIIQKQAAQRLIKTSLELGGKNATVIFADADMNESISTAVRAAFSNQGQICLCGSRVFVETSVYEEFLERFKEKTEKLTTGDPLKKSTQIGAVTSEDHMNKILSYINLAVEEGGEIITGGKREKIQGRCSKGYFVSPTIITGLMNSCKTNQEEIFGPVVSIIPFDSEKEVLGYINESSYGLACNLWTGSLSRAHRMATEIETGILWINCWMIRDLRTPFGGMKESGMGREGGWEAMKFFTEPTSVTIKF